MTSEAAVQQQERLDDEADVGSKMMSLGLDAAAASVAILTPGLPPQEMVTGPSDDSSVLLRTSPQQALPQCRSSHDRRGIGPAGLTTSGT